MDRYREQLLQARQKADAVNLLKKNSFLSSLFSEELDISDENSFAPTICNWYRAEGYRALETEADTKEAVSSATFGWLRSADTCSVFVLDNVQGELHVLYGAGNTNNLPAVFQTAVPECILTPSHWSGHPCRYTGAVSGTLSVNHLADSFAGMGPADCYAACIAVPVNDDEIWEKIRENETLIGYFERFKSVQRVYGSATRRTEEIPIPEIVSAVALLKEENQFLQHNAGRGFVRSCVRFGANDEATYRQLAHIIRSCMYYGSNEQDGYEPIRIFNISSTAPGLRECLAVPRAAVSAPACPGYADVISWQTIPSLSAFCSMPANSCSGFYVQNYNVDNNSRHIFPETRPIVKDGITAGSLCSGSGRAVIPLSALTSHTFVTGATRSGKTTTVKRIVKDLHDRGIPALVIEAAKKEYIRLLPVIPELRIYTPGTDGWQLSLNPLQVEEGTLIENHVDAVVRAITAATAGEHPIPEALEGLLKETYEKAGWTYGALAYIDKNKPFPTFRDAYEHIPEYIKTHARYGPEVRQNLEGALTLRTESLYTGALGRTFSSPFGLTAKDLLETPTVIELTDFSDSGTEFLMNILLFKLHSYLLRLQETSTLKRVIVVEEAHNVFRKTLTDDNGRARNNEYMEKMLAEISASGTGLILCDQRPSILSDAVMANTQVKIAHSLSAASDCDLMAASLGLSKAQTDRLRELDKGTCLIGLRGTHGVQYARIETLPETSANNPACHICSCRFRCRKDSVSDLLQTMAPEKIRYHLSKIQANPYNSSVLTGNIDRMLNDLNISASNATKCCLLGLLLQTYSSISFQEERVIINSYHNYLKGGAA